MVIFGCVGCSLPRGWNFSAGPLFSRMERAQPVFEKNQAGSDRGTYLVRVRKQDTVERMIEIYDGFDSMGILSESEIVCSEQGETHNLLFHVL